MLKEKLLNTVDGVKASTPKVEILFERVKDAQSLFELERRIQRYISLFALAFFIVSIIEFLVILTLIPLKEKEPYLVGFSNATQSFVTIQKADEEITANESLIKSLINAYIYNREEINGIDDKERHEVVRLQSNTRVWQSFENLIAQEQSIYANSNLVRKIEIINLIKFKDGYMHADVVMRLYNKENMSLAMEKRYKIVVVYKFNKQKISFELQPKNPTGFIVVDYSVSETHIIKELNENNKLNISKSRIILPKSNEDKEITSKTQNQASTNTDEFNNPFK